MIQRSKILHGILIVLLLVVITWSAAISFDGRALNEASDANGLLRMGYHLYNSGTISYDVEELDAPQPTAYREPAYSVYHAFIISLSSKLQSMDLKTMNGEGEGLRMLRLGQIPILLITALLSMYLAFQLTHKMVYGYSALLLTGLSVGLFTSMQSLKIEHFSALWVVLVAILFYKVMQKKTKKWFSALGIGLGILVLTKAIYMYFLVIILIYLFYLYRKNIVEKRNVIWGASLMGLFYILVVGSWMTRNYIHFGKFYITHRGGVVMLVRAKYNQMNATEYFGSFLYWTPDNYAQKVLYENYGRNALSPGGVLYRLNRDNPEGYYKSGRAVRGIIEREHKGEVARNEERVEMEGMKQILQHPIRNLLIAIPLGWQGIFVEKGYRLNAPFSMIFYSSVVINVVYFLSLFGSFIWAIKKKAWSILAVSMVGLYLYGLHTLVTHNIPRYNEPLIPLLVVLFLFIIYFLSNRERRLLIEPNVNVKKSDKVSFSKRLVKGKSLR